MTAPTVLDPAGFAAVLDGLRADGHQLVGPTARDGAIVLAPIAGADDLPAGVGDEQAPGRYRLRERGDRAWFGHAATAQPWKRELFPPRVPLVQIRRRERALEITTPPPPAQPLALIGVRACDLAAIAIHDRVLLGGAHPDADYRARRAGAFVLAVHCGAPAATCFCAALGTGPRVGAGHDLALTELGGEPGGEHRFVVEVGSARGAAALARAATRAATTADLAEARAVTDRAAAAMHRTFDRDGVHDRLLANLEHPRWQAIADRCLGCASCTLSCPTCFCVTIDDATDLGGDVATRTRRWDSCLSAGYAYVHGGSARPSLRARYRQWLTHKLATWHDQFGTAGCVGCGRCITWCPVGIDLTDEVAALGSDRERSCADG